MKKEMRLQSDFPVGDQSVCAVGIPPTKSTDGSLFHSLHPTPTGCEWSTPKMPSPKNKAKKKPPKDSITLLPCFYFVEVSRAQSVSHPPLGYENVVTRLF